MEAAPQSKPRSDQAIRIGEAVFRASRDGARRDSSAVSPYLLKRDRYSSHSVILSLLGDGGGRTLLDIGAAQGDVAALLTGVGFQVIAVEGDPTFAAMAG